MKLNLIRFIHPTTHQVLIGRHGKTFRFDVSFDPVDLTIFIASLPDYNLRVKGSTGGSWEELIHDIYTTVFDIWRRRDESYKKLILDLEEVI